MTKILQHKVTCSNCQTEYPAMVVYSISSFLNHTPEDKQQMVEAADKSAVCPNCGTKNEVSANLPKWLESDNESSSDPSAASSKE
jgi:hypothetical protein